MRFKGFTLLVLQEVKEPRAGLGSSAPEAVILTAEPTVLGDGEPPPWALSQRDPAPSSQKTQEVYTSTTFKAQEPRLRIARFP